MYKPYILDLFEIDKTKRPLAGGKGANLGELVTISEIRVPAGFCVSTEAFRKVTEGHRELSDLLDALARLRAEERGAIGVVTKNIRSIIENLPMPETIATQVAASLGRLGAQDAYAVRSSATAEDSPTASFAGQQDTYLNIIGMTEVLRHVSKCWAPLFTERAAIYRMQNRFAHHRAQMAVVVQKMVLPQAAGILFMADPVTGNRKVSSIDASFGLGEAVVSGLVNADCYKVREGAVIAKKIGSKMLAVHAARDGGTKHQEIEPAQQNRQALADEQILQLERLGRTIEAHFGQPQDIEWCWSDGAFYIVQSRPITTLYPIPEVQDSEKRIRVNGTDGYVEVL
jgi:rifampicin phosphotransferase